MTLCILPWLHMFPQPHGAVLPCCVADHRNPVGNMKTQTLSEVWSSVKMVTIREDMLAGRENSSCSRCYRSEDRGGRSLRQEMNAKFSQHLPLAVDAQPAFQLRHLDIRFNNLCNLKCRSCGEYASTSWHQDAVALGRPVPDMVLVYPGKTQDDLLDQLMEHLDTVESINFAGGEPLMMPDHYKFLDKLIELGRTDVQLTYFTNLTHLGIGQSSVFDYWEHFPNVTVAVSLDGSGRRGELIRKGLKWDELVANFLELKKHIPANKNPALCTLSVLNGFHVVDFHKELIDLGLIEPGMLRMNLVLDPDVLSLQVFPQNMNEELQAQYTEHADWLATLPGTEKTVTAFRAAVNYLKAGHSKNIEGFVKYTQAIDAIRGENTFEVCPELAPLASLG